MNQIVKELEELDKEIKTAEEEVSREEGKLQTFMERLKEEFEVNSLEEAETMLAELKAEKEQNDNIISEKFSALKENYSW